MGSVQSGDYVLRACKMAKKRLRENKSEAKMLRMKIQGIMIVIFQIFQNCGPMLGPGFDSGYQISHYITMNININI